MGPAAETKEMGRDEETTVRHRLKRLRSVARRGGLLAILASLCLCSSAFAAEGKNLPGLFARFDYCPTSTPELADCMNSLVKGGLMTIGKKTVPIVNPVTLQGGFGFDLEPQEQVLYGTFWKNVTQFYGATNGVTLSKTPEPVPGGLLGLVPPASSPPSIKELAAASPSSVTATVEIAGPAVVPPILFSEFDAAIEFGPTEGTALHMSIKVHLENPFLGSSCYIGSNSSPINLNLWTGPTEPPPPGKPLHGTTGTFVVEGASDTSFAINGTALVGNDWSAPGVTGCGGALAPIVDPLIDSAIGLPSAAGRNTAIFNPVNLSLGSANIIAAM
jgi:hypothetical protein